MRKVITIGDKQYSMKASAFTQFAYKNETGRSFLQDIKKLADLTKDGLEGLEFEIVEEMTPLALQLAYVMIEEADSSQIVDYESFLKSIDNLYDDQEWIKETILLGCSPISRQLQNS